jgi:hypothetical protein
MKHFLSFQQFRSWAIGHAEGPCSAYLYRTDITGTIDVAVTSTGTYWPLVRN